MSEPNVCRDGLRKIDKPSVNDEAKPSMHDKLRLSVHDEPMPNVHSESNVRDKYRTRRT